MKSDFKSMLSVFLNSEAIFQKPFFSSVPACEAVGENMPDNQHTQDWLLHHDNAPCHTDSQLFPVPNQKKMVVLSGLCTSPS
jgi:hypothetical protein